MESELCMTGKHNLFEKASRSAGQLESRVMISIHTCFFSFYFESLILKCDFIVIKKVNISCSQIEHSKTCSCCTFFLKSTCIMQSHLNNT